MSAFGDAAAVPPEINHVLMRSGDQGLSLTAAAAGHQALAEMLMAEMAQMGFNTATVATGFQGLGGTSMTMSAGQYMGILGAAVAWLQVASTQALEVVQAHQAALTAMIPAEVALTNRSTQMGLISTNFFGQNTPGIVGLEAQYQEFWAQNAQLRTGFGAAVAAALAALATPAPLNPAMTNPGDAVAGAAQAAAQAGAQSGLQAASQSMTSASEATTGGTSEATQSSTAGTSMMSSLGSEFGSVAGQASSMLGQGGGLMNPSMLSSAPSMMSGLLGSLGSGMGGMGSPGALSGAEAAAAAGPAMGGGAMGAGGGVGGLGGAPTLASSFVRPASSFSTPTEPKLPGGWSGGTAEPAAAKPSGSGGGGLFGAPGAMGQHGSSPKSDKTSGRSMQLTARRGAERGEEARI